MSSPSPGELEEYRAYLYRYALLHVRDANRAEDAVQETLLAAIEGGERFGGRASLKTWLTGILKHKITDLFRRQSRESQAPAAAEGEDEHEFGDHLFDQARLNHSDTVPTSTLNCLATSRRLRPALTSRTILRCFRSMELFCHDYTSPKKPLPYRSC